MGGIALVYNRDEARVDDLALAAMAAALSHRGPDGCDSLVRGPLGLVHQHFWTTPEEQGLRQPLADPNGRYLVAFDGRLDNRDELLRDLGLDGPETRGLSDAAVTMQAYERWREACCGHFLGSFAFAIYDILDRRLFCVRDPLGDCTLYYHQTARRLLVASEAGALLMVPGVSDALDEASLAAHFAGQSAGRGRTFFEQVRELPPGHCLAADGDGCRLRRYWEPDLSRRVQLASDGEYSEQYRALLGEAVRCRMRSPSPVGVMMSGGLDSTSVSALAAGYLGEVHSLQTISFVFDELADCDERGYIRAVEALYSTTSHQILGDDAWPLAHTDNSLWNPGEPDGNPYRELKQRVYERARHIGVRTLLTGGFSDHMYSGAEHWLADLVREKRLTEARGELRRYATHMGWRRTLKSATLRHAVRAAVPFASSATSCGHRPPSPAPWITEFVVKRLPFEGREAWAGVRRSEQAQAVLGTRAAHSASAETFYANRAGVDLRYPYRDLRLVEFMLAIPAHQLFNRGLYKYILRKAMWDRLPDSIRRREKATSLLALYVRGIYQRGANRAKDILSAEDALWPKYVRPDWLWGTLTAGTQAPSRVADGVHQIALWNCISFELWRWGADSGMRFPREAVRARSDV